MNMLAPGAQITAQALDQFSTLIIAAKSYRAMHAGDMTIEQARMVADADRAIERLTDLDASQLSPDALPRFGELLAASKGLTMKQVGPIAHGFRVDRSAISTIMGPYGSAKTTTCFQKVINHVMWQPPGPDGVKRGRACVVRDTYGHLEANVMADWFMWFPKTEQNWNQRQNTHKLTFDIPMAGGKVQRLYLEMLFRAVDTQSAEELFKGLSLSLLWLNEKDTLSFDVFKYGFPRVGRYRSPGTPIGGWSGLIGDMNAPEEDNWTYDFNVNKNIGLSPDEMLSYQRMFGDHFKVSFHQQPGGMSPGAENLANLPPGYYERMQIGMSEMQKRRFIHNKFGAVRDGNPVYSQYNDSRHCIEDMRVDKKLVVHMSLDGGNTPAALFGQKTAAGQIRVVDEVVIFKPGKEAQLESMGAKEFGQACGRYWNEHFAGCTLAKDHWADPSCWYGDSPKNIEDRAWIIRFEAGFNETAIGAKIKFKPAPIKGNRVGPRIESVRERLSASITDQPAYVISNRCRILRQGYNSGYVTIRVQFSTGGGRWQDEPLKNDFSHVHDANQYLVLGLSKFDGWEDAETRDRMGRDKRRGAVNFGNGHFAHQPSGGAVRPRRRSGRGQAYERSDSNYRGGRLRTDGGRGGLFRRQARPQGSCAADARHAPRKQHDFRRAGQAPGCSGQSENRFRRG